jgi:Transposase IS66 family
MHPSWRSPPRRGLLENSRDVLTTALASISRKSSLAVLFAAASHAGQASPRLAYDGRLEMTKNAINRAIRPLASARRNYLFACSDADDRRATILYTPDPERDPQRPPSRGLSALHLARIADHRINGIDDLLPGPGPLRSTLLRPPGSLTTAATLPAAFVGRLPWFDGAVTRSAMGAGIQTLSCRGGLCIFQR